MILPFFFGAAPPNPMDPTLSTVTALIGNLGSAGAAVVMAWFFLSYLRSSEAQRDKRYEELVDRLTDKLADNSAAMRQFSQSANGICRAIEHPQGRRQP